MRLIKIVDTSNVSKKFVGHNVQKNLGNSQSRRCNVSEISENYGKIVRIELGFVKAYIIVCRSPNLKIIFDG